MNQDAVAQRPIRENAILLGVSPPGWDGLVHCLAETALHSVGIVDPAEISLIAASVRARVADDALLIANGVACIPEVSTAVEHPVGALVTLSSPLAMDPPVEGAALAAFLFVAPPAQRTTLIKLSCAVERRASDQAWRDALLSESSPDWVHRMLEETFQGHELDLCAGDVMRAPYFFLTPDLPLGAVIRKMLRYNLEATGIVDEDRRLVGEISSDDLFRMGLPNFFNQLKNVAFVGDFDPFEKYFEKAGALRASDVMTPDVATVSEDTPILDVIFKLAVEKRWKVYVLEDGVLRGVIDRTRVLRTVLTL